jgi:hypothetical protein
LYRVNLKSSGSQSYFTTLYVLSLKIPDKVNFENNILHCSNGPAIKYPGYEMYYWKGGRVPKKLIMTPEKINKEDIKKHTENAEQRRAFIEVLGVKRYFDILSNGNGIRNIDNDIDNQGNKMSLIEFNFEGENIQCLEVRCPSTTRIYNLYPPNQRSKNVWEAKASTFNKSITEFKPIIET